MESYLYKFKRTLKFISVFSLLLSSLLFAAPASALSREVNPTLSTASLQLAYYGGYYHNHWRHYHRWHRGHHWHRGHWHHRHWRR